MPAISFNKQFLDPLLRGDKRQTTRKQTDRIKVGDICNIYINQRTRITDKPLRLLTKSGNEIAYGGHQFIKNVAYTDDYHAHFLGKVQIMEVYDIVPTLVPTRSQWAKADGFDNFACADTWFTDRYGEDWCDRVWTVIRWSGWAERYFEPKP